MILPNLDTGEPVAKRSRTSYFPIKIPIYSLSGGVGKQAPSKRLPTESETMDNMFCTLERSIEKRSGMELLLSGDLTDPDDIVYGILEDIGDPSGKDLWFYWFVISTQRQYLIVLDCNATQDDQRLMWVYSVTEDGRFEANLPSNDIDSDIREYLTGSPDSLKATTIGSSIVILNTDVDAMYESNESITGKKIEYQTSITVDPENIGEIWTSHTDYVWGPRAIDTSDPHDLDTTRYGIWKVKDSLASGALPGPTNAAGSGNKDTPSLVGQTLWERVTEIVDGAAADVYTEFIPAEDYFYPDPDKLYLGQSVAKFSDLKFPPDLTDYNAYNGGIDVELMIKGLYPGIGNSDGKGKILYLSQAYLASSPGWYRVIDIDDKPYLEKVRTPHENSVFNSSTFPVMIFYDEENNDWGIRKIKWEPRTSGDKNSNPGPSLFLDRENVIQPKAFKAIAYYRDRLFLASEDTLFSSRLGKFDDFWLKDPSNITFKDPIDIRVSSNKYTPITYLQPYRDFLFLATRGDTQYELLGSENQISPLTAEIAPTSFFPMTTDIAPVLMNNNLFFFSKNRLFIYFGQSDASTQQAFEVSSHVPTFLPDSFSDVTASSAHNTIFVLNGNGTEIFCYTNRISGDSIAQNAFYRFLPTGGTTVKSIEAIGDYLYVVSETTTADGINRLFIGRINLLPELPNLPRLDNRFLVEHPTTTYDSATDATAFYVERCSSKINKGIIASGKSKGTILDITVGTDLSNEDRSVLFATGNWLDTQSIYFGSTYKSEVELSPLFLRDEGNNIYPGTLNLRYGIVRHFNTGNYEISVQRKERTPQVYTFNQDLLGESVTGFDNNPYEPKGTFKFPILGFSKDIKIKLTSEFPHPLNITNIEITGKFKRVPHHLTT